MLRPRGRNTATAHPTARGNERGCPRERHDHQVTGVARGVKGRGAVRQANPGVGGCRGWIWPSALMGYECKTAMTGNPLISWERRSLAGSSTFSVGAPFLLLFRPVSG